MKDETTTTAASAAPRSPPSLDPMVLVHGSAGERQPRRHRRWASSEGRTLSSRLRRQGFHGFFNFPCLWWMDGDVRPSLSSFFVRRSSRRLPHPVVSESALARFAVSLFLVSRSRRCLFFLSRLPSVPSRICACVPHTYVLSFSQPSSSGKKKRQAASWQSPTYMPPSRDMHLQAGSEAGAL